MPKNFKKSNPPVGPPSAWQIQTAKARFSEVFRLARTEGPQRITRQGKEGVVMISDEQAERLRMLNRASPKAWCSSSGNLLWPAWNSILNGTRMPAGTSSCERVSARHQHDLRTHPC